ncbi:MAG: aspartate 1-decarboxylase [Ostreibacterium sp.]
MRLYIHAKIHQATVTQANLGYVGSITIDKDLLEMSGLQMHEKVLVVSNTSGSRLETYIIEGEAGSGVICMNGAAAHLIKQGEEIIIIGFELADKAPETKFVLVDKHNRFVRYLHEKAGEKSASA